MTSTPGHDRRVVIGKILRVASGNFLEMYDFVVYGYYAIYIADKFFPKGNEFAGLMLSRPADGRTHLKFAQAVSGRVPIRGDLVGSIATVEGILAYRDGGWEVRVTGPQGSGILTSMTQANCFIVLDEERGDVAPGERVRVEPFVLR